MNSLWARKPIADAAPEGPDRGGLKRTLGTKDLVALSIGAVIGAGIFSTLGTAAAGSLGPNGEVLRYGRVRRDWLERTAELLLVALTPR